MYVFTDDCFQANWVLASEGHCFCLLFRCLHSFIILIKLLYNAQKQRFGLSAIFFDMHSCLEILCAKFTGMIKLKPTLYRFHTEIPSLPESKVRVNYIELADKKKVMHYLNALNVYIHLEV